MQALELSICVSTEVTKEVSFPTQPSQAQRRWGLGGELGGGQVEEGPRQRAGPGQVKSSGSSGVKEEQEVGLRGAVSSSALEWSWTDTC